MPEERKLVTVLFADVTGSTALGEELDAEDMRALMGRYYEHARRVVESHGGTLEKFIGDAVMAVFGLPHAHGDDAERAIAAALAFQKAVEGDPLLARMTLRIGVNTGEVMASSEPSSGDFLVTGDAVNVAARLQQCANPGEILVGERTRGATESAFLFGDHREAEVRGKREPLRVFPVGGVLPIRQVERPPLIGRKQDLLHLSVLQMHAREEHRPQLVSIVAPAGTGKTRLLEEFLARLDPEEAWHVATGRCLPYGQTLTYWPLRGLLGDLLGGMDRDRVVQAFISGGNNPEDALRLSDLVLATLGIETETVTERESIFNAWRLLVEGQAREVPRIVIFEDLHWASDSLLDLVEHIMQPRTQAPLLIIATSRPELLDRRPTWGGGRESFIALSLPPLNDLQTRELVERLGATLPESVRRRIVERSGGNPFFATELVRGFRERTMAGEATDALPDTVHAAVLARLDLLTMSERAVLQAASVAGRAFRPATLDAVLENLGLVEINAAIESLLARGLAVPAEEDAYTFHHILIRDVAYGTLSRAERIRMHAKTGVWLEGYAANRLDEFTELIAYHYREAMLLARRSAVPLPLPMDPARAVSFLERAGELARRAGAFGEAGRHLEGAIDIAPADQHMQLHEKLGDCAFWGEAARDAYQEALRRWRQEEEQKPLVGARLLRKLLILYLRFGVGMALPGNDEIVEMQAEALRLAERAGEEYELWRIRVADLFWLGWRSDLARVSIPTQEELEDGRQTALAAAAYFEERSDWDAVSETLDGYGVILRMLGLHTEAITAARRRLAAPDIPVVERADALGVVTWAHFSLGEYDRCLESAWEALATLRPGTSVALVSLGMHYALWASCITGEWSTFDDLLAVVEETGREALDDSSRLILAGVYWPVLYVALAREDRVATDAAFSVLEPLARNFPSHVAYLHACREDDPRKLILDPSSPGNHFPTTLMFVSEHGVHAPRELLDAAGAQAPLWGDWLTRLVRIAEALEAGDPVRLADAIDDAERYGLIVHATRMRIILAQMTGDPVPLEQARPVLERLEDRQYMRRLEEVAASLG